MSLSGKTTGDLVRIVAAGGAIEIGGTKTTSDLVRIAAATATASGHLTVFGAGEYTTSDLVRIAAAAPGKVTFKD